MKNKFKYYIVAWAILLVIFNLVAFLVKPNLIPGASLDAGFWIAWGGAAIAFVGNLICTYMASKAKDLTGLFYKIPLITISYGCLIAMFVVGGVLMLIPGCPAWIVAVICIIILGINAIAVVKASAAADIITETGEKVKNNTAFIRTITVDAENLMGYAKTDEAKAQCKKVYEVLRYSDPVSNDALADIEGEIKQKFAEFSTEIKSGRDVDSIAERLVNLISDRNRKCKALK